MWVRIPPRLLSVSFFYGGCYVTAGRMMDVVSKRFDQFGFPLVQDRKIIPDDDTTLFVCSGMQNHKSQFRHPDGSKHGSIQSCVRTNDLDLVGDGTHLTSFQMVGNFSFGGNDYERSIDLWHNIVNDLEIKVSTVHVHPDSAEHEILWKNRGYTIVHDLECVWSDGDIGGFCCELYVNDLEIGNLVNPLGHSTDVGFGLERILQVIENKSRVDETSLFDQSMSPIGRDHQRTVKLMRENGIKPGNKGREYVCRRLLRRMLRQDQTGFDPVILDWIEEERKMLDMRIKRAKSSWKRHKDKPVSWWWDSFGILPEEMDLIRL